MHKKKKSVWKKILWLIRPYLHFLMLSFVFAGISALLTLYAPILIGNAVDLIIGKGSVDFDAIGRILFRLAGIIIITSAAQWLMNLCNNHITYRVVKDVRTKAFAKLQKLPLKYVDSHAYGETISRIITDVEQFSVFARVSPEHKMRIVKAWQKRGKGVAMTGDGVNDSPALKAADIGVAMGVTGTDVAKDASDMILLDDSFTTIAYAIKEGRRVYRNIQKVIQFLLVGNIAEILTLFLATALNWEAPLLAVHILWVNLATATLPALALGVDPASKNIMKHPPVRSGTLFERDLVRRVVTQGIFVALLTTAAYWIGVRMADHTTGQTMAFCVLALSQMLRAFNQRSNTEPIWVRAEGINPWLIVSFGVSALLMAAILWIPPLQSAFQLTTLSGLSWLVVLGLSLLSILQVEVSKAIRRLGI